MPIYRLDIAYDGTDFAGWQVQKHKPTIQGTLMEVLSILDGRREVKVTGAGRTDAGVHASGQVASTKLEREWQPQELEQAINGNLPDSIAVTKVREMPRGFDARRMAIWREYVYTITQARNPLLARYSWLLEDDLDINLMQQTAAKFIGEHDFCSYSSTFDDPGKSTVRNLMQFQISKRRDRIEILLRANSFVTHQARFLVAMLTAVGSRELTVVEACEILQKRERGLFKGIAPAKGLCLKRVGYPPKSAISVLCDKNGANLPFN